MNTISLRPQIPNKSELKKRKKLNFAITEKLKDENRTYIEWLNYKPDCPRSHDFLKYFVITKLRSINNKNPFDAYSMIDKDKDTYFTDFYINIYKDIARNYYDILNKFDRENMKTIYQTIEVKIPKRNKDRSLKYKRIKYKNQIINTIRKEISDDLSKLKNISIFDILERNKLNYNVFKRVYDSSSGLNNSSSENSNDRLSDESLSNESPLNKHPNILLPDKYPDFIEVYNNINPNYVDYSDQNAIHNAQNNHNNDTNYEMGDEQSNYVEK